MANSAKVILKKEYRRKNNDTGLPADLSDLSSASSTPLPSPLANENKCFALRNLIRSTRPEITRDMISYARLSLVDPNPDDYDGEVYNRFGVNIDISFNNNTKFQRYKFRLTNKRSEFYGNLPTDWPQDQAYGSAWAFYNSMNCARWIGKACYRNQRGRHANLKMVPLTSMVMWRDDQTLRYQFWIENAEVAGTFDIESRSRYYIACSEPVHNFQPTAFEIIKL